MKNLLWTSGNAVYDTAKPRKIMGAILPSGTNCHGTFKCGKQPDIITDRGRYFCNTVRLISAPSRSMEVNTFPYESGITTTTDAATGMFFLVTEICFANKTTGDDCYKLVHSDMRGEINNPQWQFELTRRNNNGMGTRTATPQTVPSLINLTISLPAPLGIVYEWNKAGSCCTEL